LRNWRIYRLPGSREVWHLDSGPGTDIYNVRGYRCFIPSHSVDIGGTNVPRAWIQIHCGCSLHIINGIAIFSPGGVLCKKTELSKCVAVQE
jgi:hypothetical protein